MKPNIVGSRANVVKAINRRSILEVVRREESLSRTDIAKTTGLTPATVTNLVAELLELGFVLETGTADSSGGRKPVLLELNPTAGYMVSVQIDHQVVRAVLCDLRNQVVERTERVIAPAQDLRDTLIPYVRLSMNEMIGRAGVDPAKILGLGVSTVFTVEPDTGAIWIDTTGREPYRVLVRETLSEALELPVVVDSQVNHAAMGECWYGRGRDLHDFVYLWLDEQVDGALVMHSQVYQGAKENRPMLAHLSLDIDGPACECGNYGCLAQYASVSAVELQLAERVRRGSWSAPSNGDSYWLDLQRRLNDRDSNAVSFLEELGRTVGLALVNLANLVNPELIILDGSLVHLHPVFLEAAGRILRERTSKLRTSPLSVECGQLYPEAALLGGATAVLHRIVIDPVLREESIDGTEPELAGPEDELVWLV